MTLSATRAERYDAERIRLRLGTEFIEHGAHIWSEGGTPEPEWIRANIFKLLAMLESALRRRSEG